MPRNTKVGVTRGLCQHFLAVSSQVWTSVLISSQRPRYRVVSVAVPDYVFSLSHFI